MTNKRNWVVSVSSEHDNPLIFGPYTRARAEELAEKFNAKANARTDDDQLGAFLHAGTYPIQNEGIRAILATFDLYNTSNRKVG